MGLDRWLIHLCDVESGSAVRDAVGGETFSWTVESGSVPCRLMENTETDPSEAIGELYVQTYTLLLKPGVTVARQGYRINNLRDSDGNSLPESGPFSIEAVTPRRDSKGVRLQSLSVEIID